MLVAWTRLTIYFIDQDRRSVFCSTIAEIEKFRRVRIALEPLRHFVSTGAERGGDTSIPDTIIRILYDGELGMGIGWISRDTAVSCTTTRAWTTCET